MNRILEDVRAGNPVGREAARELIACRDDQLPALLAAAREVKERFRPQVVTYSRKVFLPLTNLCRDYCRYCTFRKDPAQPGAHTMTPEEVLGIARAGEKLGCREALFSLGDKPEVAFPQMRATLERLGYKSTLHYLEAMCELALRETGLLPHANPGLMSGEWIERLAQFCPSLGLMMETTADLARAGGAHDRATDKLPEKRFRVLEEAGRQGVPFTTGLLIGIVETLFAIRAMHERYGHVQEVIIQNFRAKADIPMNSWPEPGQGEMLRTLAVARLVLGDMNLQAPPNLSSPHYPELLRAGINDWGGVSPLTPDHINPEAPWPQLRDLEARTAEGGCTLRPRLTVYPEFVPQVLRRGGLVAQRVRAFMDNEGYAHGAAA